MSVGAAFRATLREIATTRALWSTMLVAVLFYAFYYPAPYRHQAVVDLPVVVVDEEDSAATRAFVTALDDTHEIAVVARAANEGEALRMVQEREADGVLRLSRGLTERLVAGRGTGGISLQVNGAYLLRAQAVGSALEAVATDAAREAAAVRGVELSAPVVVRPLFNTTAGYADYIFPAVAIVILQQTLLFGAAMLAGQRRRRGDPILGTVAGKLGTLAALTLIGTLGMLFYFGPVFFLLDMPRGGNLAALVPTVPLFALAVAALGTAIGGRLDQGDRAMELLVPTSLLVFFLTGAAWPAEMMPAWVRALAFLSPATHGVPLFVGLNQMGAQLAEVGAPLAKLALLTVGALLLVFVPTPGKAWHWNLPPRRTR